MIGLLRKLSVDDRASSATEMALSLPLLLMLAWAPLEIGNYFMDEHMLIKGVRDGATFAAHQDVTKFNCATGVVDPTVVSDTKNIVRSGQLSSGVDRLRNWGSATFTLTVASPCATQANGTTLSGIYKFNGGKVPVITVDASVAYSPILGNLGFRPATLTLKASQQATVMGI
jgi:Flp pilus assembly protein TadG